MPAGKKPIKAALGGAALAVPVGLPVDSMARSARRKKLREPLAAALASGSMEDIAGLIASHRTHPDSLAKARLRGRLTAAHFDAVIQASPALETLVSLMRELVDSFRPDESFDHLLEPLQKLLHNHGGGRPSEAKKHERWRVEYDTRQRVNRTKRAAQEIYEDMVAEENEARAKRGAKPIKWRQIQAGVGLARKAKGEPGKPE